MIVEIILTFINQSLKAMQIYYDFVPEGSNLLSATMVKNHTYVDPSVLLNSFFSVP